MAIRERLAAPVGVEKWNEDFIVHRWIYGKKSFYVLRQPCMRDESIWHSGLEGATDHINHVNSGGIHLMPEPLEVNKAGRMRPSAETQIEPQLRMPFVKPPR